MMKSLSILPNLGEEASLFSTPFYRLSPLKTENPKGLPGTKIPQRSAAAMVSNCWWYLGDKMLRWRILKCKGNSCADWVLISFDHLKHLLASVCIVFYYRFCAESVGNPDWGTVSLR